MAAGAEAIREVSDRLSPFLRSLSTSSSSPSAANNAVDKKEKKRENAAAAHAERRSKGRGVVCISVGGDELYIWRQLATLASEHGGGDGDGDGDGDGVGGGRGRRVRGVGVPSRPAIVIITYNTNIPPHVDAVWPLASVSPFFPHLFFSRFLRSRFPLFIPISCFFFP